MTVETDDEVEMLKRIGAIVARCLAHMGEHLEPGITTRELDAIGEAFLEREGARSAPRLTYDFPGATCISVNDQVAHGVPSDRVVEAGDVVNIDVSGEKDGYFGDTGGTFLVPPVRPEDEQLCDATRRALGEALLEARAGQPLNRIGHAIERVARASGYHVVRNIGSHGVGRALHEEPGFIAGYYDRRDGRRLGDGMVITIEPFLTTGPPFVEQAEDGWTLLNGAGHRSAQYEHTLIVTRGRPIITTAVV